MARIRNLNADEIVDQVYWLNQQAQQYYNLPLSNIVYMGMGEPMLNYKNMLRSLHLLTSAAGLIWLLGELPYQRLGLPN